MSIQLKIKTIFANLTIDSIIADFTKKVTDLDKLVQAHSETSAFHTASAKVQQSFADFHAAEAIRASKIQAKIEALIQ